MANLSDYFGLGTATGQIVNIKETGSPDGLGGYRFFNPFACILDGKLGNSNECDIQIRLTDFDLNSPSGPAAIAGNIDGDTFFDLNATYTISGANSITFHFDNDGAASVLVVSRSKASPMNTEMALDTNGSTRNLELEPK